MVTTKSAKHQPLAGIRVLDLTVALSGPYGTLMLAALGAEVIKIEGPKGGDIARFNPPFYGKNGIHFDAMEEGDVSLSNLARARNKKSITLDLKKDEGRAIFYDLVKHADVVFENMSDGTVKRLGVDYQTVHKINPRIVYCSVNGLGDPNLFPGVKAMDITVQALSGLMDTTGFADGPPLRVGIPISDLLAPLYAVIGVQAALRQRDTTGEGQHVSVSMLECLSSLLAFEHFDVFQANGFPPRSGNHHTRLTPFGVYRTEDGHVSIAAPSDLWTRQIFEAVGQPDLIKDPRFATRGPRAVNANILNSIIEDWTSRHSTATVIDELQVKRGIPCVKVRTALETLSDAALFEAGTFQKLEHPTDGEIDAVGAGVPIHMSESQVGLNRPAVALGADNESVYSSLLGMSSVDLARLKENEII